VVAREKPRVNVVSDVLNFTSGGEPDGPDVHEFRQSTFLSPGAASMTLLDDESRQIQVLKTCRLILAALVIQLVSFLFIAVFFIPEHVIPGATEPPPFSLTSSRDLPLTRNSLLFALFIVPASLLLPRIVATSVRRALARGQWAPPPGVQGDLGDYGKLAYLYQIPFITGTAVIAGAAFVSLIAYMVERQSIALALTILLIGLVAAEFPTLGRVISWTESQQDLLSQDRYSGI